MTWSQTHRRLQALRVIEAELDRSGDGQLPWNREYADIFGDRHRLLLELQYRWWLRVEAQVDQFYDDSGRPSAALRALADRHPGLLAALRHHNWGLTPPAQPGAAESSQPEPAGAPR